MRSIGSPPTPPLALISSTAISIDTLAAWPHSAPLPVSDTLQPIFTLRPASLAPCPSAAGAVMASAAATASQAAKVGAGLIGHSPWKIRYFCCSHSALQPPSRASYRLPASVRRFWPTDATATIWLLPRLPVSSSMARVQYAWDEAKAAANLAKHGISFTAAARALEDPGKVEILDDRFEYGEERIQNLCLSNSEPLPISRRSPIRRHRNTGGRCLPHHKCTQ